LETVQLPLFTKLTREPIKNVYSEKDTEKGANSQNRAPEPQERGVGQGKVALLP
jgi:hypothetical protein